jgi:hypothetical protein
VSELTIEKGVPIPDITRPGRTPKYPIPFLDVGESFFVAGANTNSIHSAIRRHQESDKGKGKEFTVRSLAEVVKGEEDKGEQAGIRVWRTS